MKKGMMVTGSFLCVSLALFGQDGKGEYVLCIPFFTAKSKKSNTFYASRFSPQSRRSRIRFMILFLFAFFDFAVLCIPLFTHDVGLASRRCGAC